jgi:hypothetical protein
LLAPAPVVASFLAQAITGWKAPFHPAVAKRCGERIKNRQIATWTLPDDLSLKGA